MTAGAGFRVKHLNILEPGAASEWDGFVASHPNAGIFHCNAWARVICDTYRHRPHHLAFLDEEDEPVALVPLIEVASALTGRRAVCLPFSDFCPPLVFAENRWTLVQAELSRIAQERRWKYIEVRGGDTLGLNDRAAVAEYYQHVLDLSGSAEARTGRWSGGARRTVQQALNRGITVSALHSIESVRQFFELHVRTRRRHGAPPQPWAFFVNIYKHLIDHGLGFVVLARSGADAVAGAVFCSFAGRGVYKFAASDPAYKSTGANNLVLSHGMKQLSEMGARVLDFGRTAISNEGLRRFKLSWGADEQMIRYYRLDSRTGKWSSGGNKGSEWSTHLFRRLPVTVNKAVGAMIYPHLH